MIENGIKDLRFHEIIAFSYVYFMENYIKTWKEKIENKGMRFLSLFAFQMFFTF